MKEGDKVKINISRMSPLHQQILRAYEDTTFTVTHIRGDIIGILFEDGVIKHFHKDNLEKVLT